LTPPHPPPNRHALTTTTRLSWRKNTSIEQRVKDIIVEQLGVKEDQVTPEAKFIEDLGADSLDTVELVMASKRNSARKSPTRRPRNSRASATSSSTSKNAEVIVTPYPRFRGSPGWRPPAAAPFFAHL
jgi:hypothetical protein